jgi:uncharacterized protein (DUF1800 family)
MLTRRSFLKTTSAALAVAPWLQPAADWLALPASPSLPLKPNAAPPSAEIIIMNRMAFGPRPDYAAEISNAGGLTGYIDQQLNPAAIVDTECDARLAALNFQTLNLSLPQLWTSYYRNNTYPIYTTPFYEVRNAAFIRAVYSQRQLLEVLADFWHNHFNVQATQSPIRSLLVHYDRDVIRANALGNFRALLEALARSTAMLYYLDNVYSEDSGPNENFARELFELHTLSAEFYHPEYTIDNVPADFYTNNTGYIDSDVYESARAFTGWSVANGDSQSGGINDGSFKYKETWHDRFQKQVLGHQIPNDQAELKDGHDVLDYVAAHPATATNIAKKLCRRLIGDNPPQTVVEAAKATFLANIAAPDQLKQVVRTILTSSEFQSTWGQKVKRPFEHVVSALRAVSVSNSIVQPINAFTSSYYDPIYGYFNPIGQPLFEWAPPTGYPDQAGYWLNSNGLLKRWNFFNYSSELNSGGTWSRITGIKIDLRAEMPADKTTANQIVDFWLDRILHRPIEAADRSALVTFMAQGSNPDMSLPTNTINTRMRGLAALIFNSPYFLEK